VPLDRTSLDGNLFFAYNLVSCGLAQRLLEPQTRETIVERGTELIIEKSAQGKGGISGFDSPFLKIAPAFEDEITKAYDALPTETKLLGNFICVAITQRKAMLRGTFPRPISQEEEEAEDIVGQQLIELLPQMNGEETPQLAKGMNAIDISLKDLLGKILTRRDKGYSAVLSPSNDWTSGKLPDPEVRKFLRHPSIQRTAQRICALTSQESFYDANVKIDDDGVHFVDIYARRQRLISDPATDKALPGRYGWRGRSWLVREEPIICPAAHVNQMVPLVLDMTVDMLDRACEQVEQAV